MTRSHVEWLVLAAALSATACAETPIEPQLDQEVAVLHTQLAAASGGAVIIPIGENWTFCFGGDWSTFPTGNFTDPFSWPLEWGSLATLVPESTSPPHDFMRTTGNHVFQHIGHDGILRVRYEGEAYVGHGRAKVNIRVPMDGGVEHVQIGIVGDVQDGEGNWYHLVCKDVGGGSEYVVSDLKLTPKK